MRAPCPARRLTRHPRDPRRSTPGTAIPLGTLTNTIIANGAVSTTNKAVYYLFSIADSVTAVTLTIPSGFVPSGGYNLSFAFINGNSGPGFLTPLQSTTAGSAGGQMTLWLDPGSYYVELQREISTPRFNYSSPGRPNRPLAELKTTRL